MLNFGDSLTNRNFPCLLGAAIIKEALEFGGEFCAAAAAVLWFVSARIRLKERSIVKRGLGSSADDPKALLLLVYEQSRWSAWGAIAAGLAALFAIADGFLPGT